MRWCRFRHAEQYRFGLLTEDGALLPVDAAPWEAPRATGRAVPLADVELLPPAEPRTFFAVGFNYPEHVRHAAARLGREPLLPERPEVGYRAAGALVGHGAPIVRPAGYEGLFETEGELVAVIGRAVRHCSRDEAEAAVFGWTVGNDVSAREWQRSDRTLWRAKNSDSFKPMGPWIETAVDPLDSRTTVRRNGEVAAEFATGDMIFDPFDYISEISRYITLRPGDVLWMGAESTAAMAPGDTVSVEVSGVGELSNPVVSERPITAEEYS